MSDWRPTEDELNAAFSRVEEYRKRLDPIVGFRLHPNLMTSFNLFLTITNDGSKRQALKDWSGATDKWFEIIMGVNAHVRQSLTIAAYHMLNIKQLNVAVIDAFKDFKIQQNGSVGGGDTLIITAEYQAFILACRRCLDQLAWAISASLKNECTSFRKLGLHLGKEKRSPTYAAPLIDIYNKHERKFHGWLITEGSATSLRDLLAHQKSINVGTLNVNSRGVFFVGIDTPFPEFGGRQVSDVVEALFWDLHICVSELVEQLCKNLDEVIRQRTSA